MKKNTALYILAFAICLILASFVFNIPYIKNIFHSLSSMIQNPYLIVPAAICAFIFINAKNYWLIIIGCGIATALVIQFVIIGGAVALYTIAMRTLAFIIVVYLLNLIKLILSR